MQKFHVNKKTGRYGPCSAKIKCPLEENGIHFDHIEEAITYSAQLFEEQHGVGGLDPKDFGPEKRVLRDPTDEEIAEFEEKSKAEEDTPDEEINYSFVKKFEEEEAKFSVDFEGFPNSFFNKDLSQQGTKVMFSEEMYDLLVDKKYSERESLAYSVRGNHAEIAKYLANCSSSTTDMAIQDEDVENTLTSLGFTNILSITDHPSFKRNFRKAKRGWIATIDEKKVVVSDDPSRSMKNYYFEGEAPSFLDGSTRFTGLDFRRMAGCERIKRLTGENLFKLSMREFKNVEIPHDLTANEVLSPTLRESTSERARESVAEHNKNFNLEGNRLNFAQAQLYLKSYKIGVIYRRLQESQDRGKNFKSQQKFIKGLSGSVATAYMDKKNPDKIHQDMMKNTTLNRTFKKVEIDNDVDPGEMKKFEDDFASVYPRLPSIEKNKSPNLRIRKLGKHKATGVYFPHTNDIAIDVRESGSFIHEYGHYLDLTVKNNASLSRDFQPIAQAYKKQLKVPAGNKKEYYETPTEILARGWTVYAHEKLGIRNTKLLNESRLNSFDHEPFNDEKLKKRTFDFFDKLFK